MEPILGSVINRLSVSGAMALADKIQRRNPVGLVKRLKLTHEVDWDGEVYPLSFGSKKLPFVVDADTDADVLDVVVTGYGEDHVWCLPLTEDPVYAAEMFSLYNEAMEELAASSFESFPGILDLEKILLEKEQGGLVYAGRSVQALQDFKQLRQRYQNLASRMFKQKDLFDNIVWSTVQDAQQAYDAFAQGKSEATLQEVEEQVQKSYGISFLELLPDMVEGRFNGESVFLAYVTGRDVELSRKGAVID